MTITLENVGSGFKRSVINDNFTAIQDEINNNLLDKAGGKALTGDLDVNSNRLLNVSSLELQTLYMQGELVEPQSLVVGENIKVYSNVSSLKLSTLGVGTIALTKGYYTEGDGGSAYYLISPPQSVDGYGDHVLANSNVAKLISANELNILQYGAVPDGVTDNTQAIQAALDKALTKIVSYSRAEVVVPSAAGRFQVNGDINLASNVVIKGSGTIRFATTAKFTSSVDFWGIEGIKIEGSGAAGSYGIFVHEGSQSFHIRDVKFDDLDYSVWVTNSWSFWIEDNEFLNPTLKAKAGIYISNGIGTNPEGQAYGPINAGIVEGNHFAQVGAGREKGIWIGDNVQFPTLTDFHAKKISLNNNWLEGCDIGYYIAESSGCVPKGGYLEACGKGVVITGDTIRGVGVEGVLFIGDSGGVAGYFDPAIEISLGAVSLLSNSGIGIENCVFQSCERSITGNAQLRTITLEKNETYSPHQSDYYIFDAGTNVIRINDDAKGLQLSSVNLSDPPSGNYAVEAYQSGSTFVNTSHTANQFWDLPAAEKGLTYKFVNTNRLGTSGTGWDMSIRADGSDVIVDTTGEFTQASLNNRADMLEITCLVDGEWYVMADRSVTYS